MILTSSQLYHCWPQYSGQQINATIIKKNGPILKRLAEIAGLNQKKTTLHMKVVSVLNTGQWTWLDWWYFSSNFWGFSNNAF